MKLEKVIVMPIDVYNKMKTLILKDDEMTNFDKDIKIILHDKKLNDIEKWELYREKLIHHGNSFRKSDYQTNKKIDVIKHVESTPTQTKMLFKKDKNFNTETTNSTACTQTELQSNQIIKPLSSVFKTNNTYDSLEIDDEDVSYDDNDDDLSFLSNSKHSESNLHKLSPSKIIKRKMKSNDVNIKLYEMENGDIVTVAKGDSKTSKKAKQPASNPLHISAAKSANSLKQLSNKRKKTTSTPEKKVHWEKLYK